MASVSSLNSSLSKSVSVAQHFQFCSHQGPKFPIHAHSIRMTPKKLTQVSDFSIKSFKARRIRPIQAIQAEGVPIELIEENSNTELIEENSNNTTLKKTLMDALHGTERGLKANNETRAEIIEIISQLEANNPTPAPTEALQLLDGKWILVYTSFTGLFPLLACGTLPLLKVEEISQIIDSENFSVENMVVFAGPLSTTSVSTNTKFEVISPKRVQNQPNPYQCVIDSESCTLASKELTVQLSHCIKLNSLTASSLQIKFEQGVIGTPELIDSIMLPDSVEVLGRDIDLIPFKGLITSIQNTTSPAMKCIPNIPPFEFPITSDKAQTWLLTTYLDGELRISRGDGGKVFILIKEGSSLLNPMDQGVETNATES